MSAVAAAGGRRYGTKWYPPYERKTDRRGGSIPQLTEECRVVVPLLLAGKSYGQIKKLGKKKFGWSRQTADRVILVMRGEYNRQSLKRWRFCFQRVLTETFRRLGPSYFVRSLRTHLRTPPRLNDKLSTVSGRDGPSSPGRDPPSPWDGIQAVPSHVTQQRRSSWDGVRS